MKYQKWQLLMFYWRRYLHLIHIVDIYSYRGCLFIIRVYTKFIVDIYSYCGIGYSY